MLSTNVFNCIYFGSVKELTQSSPSIHVSSFQHLCFILGMLSPFHQHQLWDSNMNMVKGPIWTTGVLAVWKVGRERVNAKTIAVDFMWVNIALFVFICFKSDFSWYAEYLKPWWRKKNQIRISLSVVLPVPRCYNKFRLASVLKSCTRSWNNS